MKILIFFLSFAFTALCVAEQLPEGHPSIQEAINTSTPQGQNKTKVFSNQGNVLSIVQTDNYTYIEVQQDEKKIWLATSKVTVSDGAVIRYGKGVSMKNFYSNSLKREFPMILFVESVEVVKE